MSCVMNSWRGDVDINGRRRAKLHARSTQHDRRQISFRWQALRIKTRNPQQSVHLALLQKTINGETIGIILGHAVRETGSNRKTRLPSTNLIRRDIPIVASERQPGKAYLFVKFGY